MTPNHGFKYPGLLAQTWKLISWQEYKTSTKPSWPWKCSWMFSRCQKVSDERPFHRGGGQRGKTESQFSGEPSPNNALLATWHRRFGSQNKTLNIIALVVSRFYIWRQKLLLLVSLGPPKLISSSLKQSQKYKTYQFQCHGYNIYFNWRLLVNLVPPKLILSSVQQLQ